MNVLTKELAEDDETTALVNERKIVLNAILKKHKESIPWSTATMFAFLEIVISECKYMGQSKESFIEMIEYEYECEYVKNELSH